MRAKPAASKMTWYSLPIDRRGRLTVLIGRLIERWRHNANREEADQDPPDADGARDAQLGKGPGASP